MNWPHIYLKQTIKDVCVIIKTANRMGKKRNQKQEIYLVNVTVLEGRHYSWHNINSYVCIRVGNQHNYTKIKYHTDCPYYNEYFVFEFRTSLQQLFDKTIKLTVYKARRICRKKKVLGYTILDIASVWAQTDHQFYRKWAILSSPKSDFSGPRGYLKVTISILSKGQTPKIPLINPFDDDEIEGNLLLPEGVTLERQKALFIFSVYKGMDIIRRNNGANAVDDDDDKIQGAKQTKSLPNVYIEITFAGQTARTMVKKHTAMPIWNERLTIGALFPPLCQRIKIQLCYKFNLTKTERSIKYLQMQSIASDRANGFLPTFGPAFVHFYHQTGDFGEEYVGKVLLALQMRFTNDVQGLTHCVINEQIPPITESGLWSYENVLLFIAITDVSTIDKRFTSKSISFELNWGRCKTLRIPRENDPFGTVDERRPHFRTQDYKPLTRDNHYWYLEFKNQVPCLYITASYPNLRRRLYNANLIDKILDQMKSDLLSIERLFDHDEFTTHSDRIEQLMIEMFDRVETACRKFIDYVGTTIDNCVTDLDREKTRIALETMREMEESCRSAYEPRAKKQSFLRAEKIFRRLEQLVDHPQECWPDAYLWLRNANKKTCCLKLLANDLVHSINPDESGIYCGNLNTLYFTTTKQSKSLSPVIAKIDAYCWMGLERHMDDCFAALPKGYKLPANDGSLPMYLSLDQVIMFDCRAHIFQGRFLRSYDYTGLSDIFARLLVYEHSMRTKTMHATLNPIWDQMLIIRDITVYDSREQMALKAPDVILEILDQDRCHQIEYVGRCIIKPVIKFAYEKYWPPKFPPKLQWYEVRNDNEVIGEILAAVELLESNNDPETKDLLSDRSPLLPIPDDIKPKMKNYRMEVLFWGLRSLRKVNKIPIIRPKIVIECSANKVTSDTIPNTFQHLNFREPLKYIDMMLPEDENLVPPLSIKLYDCRSFGRCVYGGTHLAYIAKFFYHPISLREWNDRLVGIGVKSYDSMFTLGKLESVLVIQDLDKKDDKTIDQNEKVKVQNKCIFFACIVRCFAKMKSHNHRKEEVYDKIVQPDSHHHTELDQIDWWTKYYNSLDKTPSDDDDLSSRYQLKIYDNELELQPEFEYFEDTLQTIKIYRGKTTADDIVDERAIIGSLKCKIRVYEWPKHNDDDLEYVTPRGRLVRDGFFQGYPPNIPQTFLVRVYCIRGIKLRPKDLSGQCDPYLVLHLGGHVIDDASNYITKNVNPIFGKCFEFLGTFPKDHLLKIAVYDHDILSPRDFVGETRIDLENRLYTRHRAHCGLQCEYDEDGPMSWRDQHTPSKILHDLCLEYNLPEPIYSMNSIKVACRLFTPFSEKDIDSNAISSKQVTKERLALFALNHWNEIPNVGCALVPEHVETRSLYNPDTPGIEQGKIQLWVDLFPNTDLLPPYMVNIKPRQAISYELRVIVWNTEEVLLNEDDFFGDRKSDIYVKGWLGVATEQQFTDVHYRSLTGEGNFNWRFIFNFDYLSTENKILIKKKETFEFDESEMKLPCRLRLQVWDNDLFTQDDFLGDLSLQLNRIPRGAKMPQKCSMKIVEPNAPTINLFKIKRTRGWWPFLAKTKGTNKSHLAGKIEAELELLTLDAAQLNPAGFGRSAPHPLPPPKRPETSFSWISNPLKTCKHIIWKNMKFKVIKFFLLVLFITFIALVVYNFPGYSVKKLLRT